MSIRTLARYRDTVLFEDNKKQRYFIDIETEKLEKTNIPAASVITKYDYDIYEEEFSEVEEMLGFEQSLKENMKID